MTPLDAAGKPLFFKLRDADRPAPPGDAGAVRTYARALAAMQKEALVVSGLTGTTWRLASDEGEYLKGDDVAPCPLAFMTAGMAASFLGEVMRLAESRGVDLGVAPTLVQDNFYTMTGSALRGTMTGGALPVEVTLHADSAAGSETLNAVLRDAVAASPLYGLLRNVLPSRFTLSHNGRRLAPRRVLPAADHVEPLAGVSFDRAEPLAGEWGALVRRNGLSPKTAEVTSSVGSSYAEEQRRRLHVRAICRRDAAGLTHIEQQLLNPHGSVFHFVSDDRDERAPDALTYVSAGIAFCFMTQFGRYATIAGKRLDGYAVVQDTRFPGPVETHVALTTHEDDECARTILDMAEQTCFLHSLCRTEVDVSVR